MKRTLPIVTLLLFLLVLFFAYKLYWPKKPDAARIVAPTVARNRVTAYKARRDSFINDPRIGSAFYYNAEVFTKADLQAILSEKQCDGIRIFNAVGDSGRNILVITGVALTNGAYQDLLPAALSPAQRAAGAIYSEDYNIVDGNIRCPNMCDAQGLSPQ